MHLQSTKANYISFTNFDSIICLKQLHNKNSERLKAGGCA